MIGACAARFDPEVEAALLARYGVDSLDMRVTPRRIHVLVGNLPSGYWSDPTSAASWSVEAHLMASVLDALRHLAWLTVAVRVKSPPKHPDPITRPGAKPKAELAAPNTMSLAQLANLMQGKGLMTT